MGFRIEYFSHFWKLISKSGPDPLEYCEWNSGVFVFGSSAFRVNFSSSSDLGCMRVCVMCVKAVTGAHRAFEIYAVHWFFGDMFAADVLR